MSAPLIYKDGAWRVSPRLVVRDGLVTLRFPETTLAVALSVSSSGVAGDTATFTATVTGGEEPYEVVKLCKTKNN